MTPSRTLPHALASALAAIALPSLLAVEATAHVRRPPTSYAQGHVVAESRFGNGTVSGPVRPTSLGWQVRLPGGTWVYCRRWCSETLRVETIDFWEARDGRAPECGIVGCIGVHIGR